MGLGLCFYSDRAKIVFNPNKAKDAYELKVILGIFNLLAKIICVEKVDIAIDIKALRKNVFVERKYQTFKGYNIVGCFEKGSYTEYHMKRGTHLAIRVYKKIEASIFQCEITRVEMTVYPDLPIYYPEIYLRDTFHEVKRQKTTQASEKVYTGAANTVNPFI